MGDISRFEKSWKGRLFLIMGRPNHLRSNRWFNMGLMALIIANVIAVILETVDSIEKQFHAAFHIFDMISLGVFSVEYILRILCCEFDNRYGHGLKGKFRYMVSPMAVIDLLAILPSLLPIFFSVDLRILREFRLFRMVRLLKLARYSHAIQSLLNVFRAKLPELVVTFTFGVMMIVFSASIMYYVENSAQPEKFSSIPQTMWWAVATLTTVGYGDVYPITSLGKFLGAAIAFLGVGLFALPAGIVASGFAQGFDVNGRPRTAPGAPCPHCGQTNDSEAPRKFVA